MTIKIVMRSKKASLYFPSSYGAKNALFYRENHKNCIITKCYRIMSCGSPYVFQTIPKFTDRLPKLFHRCTIFFGSGWFSFTTVLKVTFNDCKEIM